MSRFRRFTVSVLLVLLGTRVASAQASSPPATEPPAWQPPAARAPQSTRNDPRPFVPSPDEYLQPPADEECFDETGWCRNRLQYWANADLLLWWRKSMRIPPLVTTSSDPADSAILGQPTTSVLYGDDRVGGQAGPGGRINAGVWLDDCQVLGIGGVFFALGDQSDHFDSRDTGAAVVGRPFFDQDPNVNAENALIVNFPGQVDGYATVDISSKVLGAEAFGRFKLWQDCGVRVDGVAGYQMARIDESLQIRQVFETGGVISNGFDEFSTRNEFNGAEIGFLTFRDSSCYTLNMVAKIGLGNMRATVTRSGSDVAGTGPDASLLVRTSNAGILTQDKFIVVPEVGLSAAFHLCDSVDLVAGYSFLYWNHVVRPGDQIDRAFPNPQPIFVDSDFFVQGLNLGLDCRF